jgi:adenine-specific DNA-methyltransferase
LDSLKSRNDKVWRWSVDRYLKEKPNLIFIESKNSPLVDPSGKKSKWQVLTKQYLKSEDESEVVPGNIIENALNSRASAELKEIDIPFDFPKPTVLVKYLVGISRTKREDIILDFFAGSCTTAHAVLELNKEDGGNRKFIMVQLPEKCDETSEAFKAGYKTIADIGKERIRRVIKKIKAEEKSKLDVDGTVGTQDLGFKVFKLQKSNFKIWRSDVNNEEELVTQLEKFTDPVDEKSKIENILYELLLKSGIPLTAKIEEKENYYLANDGEIALMLDRVDENIIKEVIFGKTQKIITLDRLFKDNDQLKTNTALQMKDAEIDFRVV